MSDPVPNDEADGVLSSIRRLVAEKPDATSLDPRNAADAALAPRAERFVLTDALRVTDPAPARSDGAALHDAIPAPAGAHANVPEHVGGGGCAEAPIVLTGPTFASPASPDGLQDFASAVTPLVRANVSQVVAEIVSGTDKPERTQNADASHCAHSPGAPAGAPWQWDEDALRHMVSDIVRSELQGALGERITRNVQKLVRREIHRALLGQETG